MKHVLEEMWAALAAYQPQAVAAGHGESWERMCREKNSYAAYVAAHAAYSASYAKAPTFGASSAARAAFYAAALAANADANARMWAQKAIDRINSVIKPAQRKADHSIKEENTCQ